MEKIQNSIPILDFSWVGCCLEKEQGLEDVGSSSSNSNSSTTKLTAGDHGGDHRIRWLCNKVREACETEGFFFLGYDKIPKSLREDMFVATKALYDLPQDTKKKYVNPKPYRSYMGKCSIVPLLESLGVDDAHSLDSAQAFTTLMWPNGNPFFCDTFSSMSSKMYELYLLLMEMIFKSFGLDQELYNSHMEDITGVFRVMKYNVPPTKDHSAIALPAHTDKNGLTILCQNEVQGLEVQTRDGNWTQVDIPQDVFTVIVGDALKAWSNGRLHAPRHRVVISGDKERYCFGLFSTPKEGAKIEVPKEFVNQEHPLLYKPFIFEDYVSYFMSNPTDDALERYAAINII